MEINVENIEEEPTENVEEVEEEPVERKVTFTSKTGEVSFTKRGRPKKDKVETEKKPRGRPRKKVDAPEVAPEVTPVMPNIPEVIQQRAPPTMDEIQGYMSPLLAAYAQHLQNHKKNARRHEYAQLFSQAV